MKNGYIFLDLDNSWISSAQKEMDNFCYEEPSDFEGSNAVGAQISVGLLVNKVREEEVEVGRKVMFELIRAGPTYTKEAEAVYKIWVRSSELVNISKKMDGPGYSKFPGDFNIVLGVRRNKKINEG